MSRNGSNDLVLVVLVAALGLACGSAGAATKVIDWHVNGSDPDQIGGLTAPFPDGSTMQSIQFEYDAAENATHMTIGDGFRSRANDLGLNTIGGVCFLAVMKAGGSGLCDGTIFIRLNQGGNGSGIYDGPGCMAHFGLSLEVDREFNFYDQYSGVWKQWSCHGIDVRQYHTYELGAYYNSQTQINELRVWVDGVLEDPDHTAHYTAVYGRGGAGENWIGIGHQRWGYDNVEHWVARVQVWKDVGAGRGGGCVDDQLPPTVPANVQATVLSHSSIKLTWAESTDDCDVWTYAVYRDGVPVGVTPVTSFTDSGLDPGTTYSYTVSAQDVAGFWSAQSSPPAQATTPPAPDTQPPSVPTGVQAVGQSATAVLVSWNASTDNVGVAGYMVYRDGSYAGISSTTGYSDTGLQPDTLYSYTVSAYDAAGNSSARSSPRATGATLPDTQSPSIPGGVQASAQTPTTARVTWAASTDDVGVTGYKVYRDGGQIATCTATSCTDTGLQPNTTHSYTVSAYDAADNSSAGSAPVQMTTLQALGIAAAKTRPDGERVGMISKVVTAVFQGYIYLEEPGRSAGMCVVPGEAAPAAGTLVDVGGTMSQLASGERCIVDAAIHVTGTSSVRPLGMNHKLLGGDMSGPGSPWLPGYGLTNVGLLVTIWGKVTHVDEAERVFYLDDGSMLDCGSPQSGVTGVRVLGPLLSEEDLPGLTELVSVTGISSCFRVTDDLCRLLIVRGGGDLSVYGAPGDHEPPSVPTNVQARGLSTTSVQATWAASTDNARVRGYRIYRNGSQAGTSTTTAYTDTGLQANMTYSYTVSAYDAAGNNSAQSSPAAQGMTYAAGSVATGGVTLQYQAPRQVKAYEKAVISYTLTGSATACVEAVSTDDTAYSSYFDTAVPHLIKARITYISDNGSVARFRFTNTGDTIWKVFGYGGTTLLDAEQYAFLPQDIGPSEYFDREIPVNLISPSGSQRRVGLVVDYGDSKRTSPITLYTTFNTSQVGQAKDASYTATPWPKHPALDEFGSAFATHSLPAQSTGSLTVEVQPWATRLVVSLIRGTGRVASVVAISPSPDGLAIAQRPNARWTLAGKPIVLVPIADKADLAGAKAKFGGDNIVSTGGIYNDPRSGADMSYLQEAAAQGIKVFPVSLCYIRLRWVGEWAGISLWPGIIEGDGRERVDALDPRFPNAYADYLDEFLSTAGPYLYHTADGKIPIGLCDEAQYGYPWADFYPTRWGGQTPQDVAAFRVWLAEKYTSVANLNAAWGTSYTTFEQIDPSPICNIPVRDYPDPWKEWGPAIDDFDHFRSKILADMWRNTFAEMKRRHPEVLLGLNFYTDFASETEPIYEGFWHWETGINWSARRTAVLPEYLDYLDFVVCWNTGSPDAARLNVNYWKARGVEVVVFARHYGKGWLNDTDIFEVPCIQTGGRGGVLVYAHNSACYPTIRATVEEGGIPALFEDWTCGAVIGQQDTYETWLFNQQLAGH